MKKIVIMRSEEHRCICFKVSSWETTHLESRLCSPGYTIRWSLEPDTFETPIRSWTSVHFHPVKLYRPPGTEKWSLSDVWRRVKSPKRMHCQNPQSSIKRLRFSSLMPETQTLSSALLFALIWDVFLFLTWERTKDGFAFVTVLSTTNSDVSARDQLQVTYRQLTIRCTEKRFASKRCSSPTSHQSICTCELSWPQSGV